MQRIFLSVGSPSTEAERDFIEGFKTQMVSAGLHPLTADASSSRPFDNINKTMTRADGVIVLALRRYVAERLIERPGGTLKKERVIESVSMPTTWNQVEAAFAHAWKLPLLVFRETSVWEDALLDRGNDWYVHEINKDGSSREVITEQLRLFAIKVRKTRRPLWHTLRAASLHERIALMAAAFTIVPACLGLAYYLWKVFS